MTDFDYQWKHLTKSPYLEHNSDRIKELLSLTNLSSQWFNNKCCLDIGCGSGRYTYAMQQLGAKVISIDNSVYAVTLTEKINKYTYVHDISVGPFIARDCALVFCYGVIHHTSDPRKTFMNVARSVSSDNYLFVMVYRKPGQEIYDPLRKIFHGLPQPLRLAFVYLLSLLKSHNFSNIHGWWDALSPTYNFSFTDDEIVSWFTEEGFVDLRKSHLGNINIIGKKL